MVVGGDEDSGTAIGDYDRDDDDDVYVQVAQESSDEVTTESQNVPSLPGVIDISHPSRLLCKSFDYSFDGNAIKLVVSNKGVSVSKLVNDTETVWTPSSGEIIDHTKVYINKDGNPELALLVTTLSGTSKETYLELKDGKWVSSNNNEERI
ncbi:hypothetical protein BEWA_045650 [Theileria equi strain WA]|uniref:Signal peptide containing protein n=1 Tax=Theileria equi strain WA TaxID=1537102 RepID=L1L9C8_THEEQ|nr:hypothetical protein BEWA_045650 [Theileria equi strain WA]EKX72101.1 hypothetical protein BEWA_045650 [Theileria equi strain WA]|eukprot:XP_004831553.1 hypothetical protein BEWA_045650 [Theileria equi strain WA]